MVAFQMAVKYCGSECQHEQRARAGQRLTERVKMSMMGTGERSGFGVRMVVISSFSVSG